MFERLSQNAQRVLVLASEESRRLGHSQVGTEHLLLGILAEGDSLAARALVRSGATLDAARLKVAEAVGVTDAGTGRGDLPLTDRAQRALERANRMSLRRHDAQVETEHVLLSVLDVEGRAGQVLRGLAVDVVALRDAVDSPTDEQPITTATEAVPGEPRMPRCPGCGSRLDAVLAHQVIASRTASEPTQDFVIAYCSACGRAIGASRA